MLLLLLRIRTEPRALAQGASLIIYIAHLWAYTLVPTLRGNPAYKYYQHTKKGMSDSLRPGSHIPPMYL